MSKLLSTTKHLIKKPLLLAAVLGVVVLAAFSPVFSQNAGAQFACRTTDNIGTTWDCGPGNITPYTTNSCDNACPKVRCVPLPADAACGDNISSTGNFTDKEGESKGTTIGGFIMEGLLQALIWILQFINDMLVILVGLIAQLLDAAIAMSLAGLGGIDAINIGWTITRDVANIFFIFILLIIAIATILRLESYGAKQLLPKLIIVALLINFSLVIAFTVVDTSNVLALAFIKEISPVSDKIASILQINKFSDTTSIPDEHQEIQWQTVVSVGWPAALGSPAILNQAFTKDTQVTNATPTTQSKPNNLVIQFFWQATILILQLTLIFVFIALSVMLLIRSVALIIIFVLAPIGFLAGILPATRGFANQWWHKLFQWSFFFPASAFMIYLSLAYGAQMSRLFTTGNQIVNTGMLFNYFATVALLMGSLIVAKQMGIVGAAAAIGIGAGLAKRARGYAGRTSLRYGAAPVAGLINRGANLASSIPVIGKPLRYALAPVTAATSAIQRAGVGVREKRYDDIKKRVTESASANRATLNALVSPGAQQAFREALLDKGQAKILTDQELQKDAARYKREKDFSKLRKIYAYNPALAAEGEPTPERQAAAISQAAQGLSTDDLRGKTNANAINNAFFADAALLNYGSQKLEASAEAFGTNMGPAFAGVFDRMVKAEKAQRAAAGIALAIPADEQAAAEEEVIKRVHKENPDAVKFIGRNQIMSVSSPTFVSKVKTVVNVINTKAEQEQEDALRSREAARRRATPITPQEVAIARKAAKKIEI